VSHQHVTTFPHDPILDLDPWVGQRQASFRFELFDGASGMALGDITPIRNASLTHDTTRTIKRQLSIDLGVADTAAINTVTDRIRVFMVFPNGTEYPLGQYMFTDASRQVFTSGRLGNMILNDEMFLVDQQIEQGIDGANKAIIEVMETTLSGLDITFTAEPTPYLSVQSWGIGEFRGSVLEALSIMGDYFSPWFDNGGTLRFIRTFNPEGRLADFDWDTGNQVIRDSIVETDDLLVAPNRFIVVSNAVDDEASEIVGIADVPVNAPHSIPNRGFVLPEVVDLQVSEASQAQAVAQGLVNRFTIFERVSISTAPDPRHDSYNVIHWQGQHWMELAWGLPLVEGGQMSHLLRKAYTSD